MVLRFLLLIKQKFPIKSRNTGMGHRRKGRLNYFPRFWWRSWCSDAGWSWHERNAGNASRRHATSKSREGRTSSASRKRGQVVFFYDLLQHGNTTIRNLSHNWHELIDLSWLLPYELSTARVKGSCVSNKQNVATSLLCGLKNKIWLKMGNWKI